MAVQLRDYQNDMKYKINDVRQRIPKGNALAVMPCRSGKTVMFTSFSIDDPNPSCAVVHRQELIGQISTTHARLGVPHNIIAPQAVINFCVQEMIKETGRSFYDPRAVAVVSGVDTLIRRHSEGERWCNSVQRWTIDEAHHARADNKWGTSTKLFPNAFGLGVTATAIRGDGKSLHHEQGGVFHELVQGIGMRALIEMKNICEYRILAPKSSIDEAQLKIGTTGDFTDKSARAAAHKSEIVGDVVRTYLQNVPGKSAVAFTVDVAQAEELAEKFRNAGVSAVALDGTTPDAVRQDAMDKFKRGEIKVLTNCELFSEGLDLPGVDVVIMARPTLSFGMYVQQFCRCLTPDPANGKTHGIIIDHVGNTLRMAEKHGMPDTDRIWRLWKEGGEKVPRNPDAIPLRACDVCTMTFEALTMTCPYCGHVHEPADRGVPKAVDGVLSEMSPQLLEMLRKSKEEIYKEPAIPYGASDSIIGAKHKQRAERIMAQNALADTMKFWGGVQLAAGHNDRQMQARFFHRFGIDVASAQGLKARDALALRDEINKTLA